MTERPDVEASQGSLPLGADDVSSTGAAAPTAAGAPPSENGVTVPQKRAVPPANVGDQGGVVVGGFDYGQVAPELESDMRATAADIVKLRNDTVVQIGLKLLLLKDRVTRGQWMRWVPNELGFSVATADRMMEAARIWKDANSSALKNSLLRLPRDTFYAITEAPEEIRDQALKQLEDGNSVSGIVIRHQTREHRDEEKVAARRRKPTPEEVKRDTQRNARQERQLQADQDARKKKEEQERDAAEHIVKVMVEDIIDLPGLIDLLEASDAKHCAFIHLLRNHLTVRAVPAKHVEPPNARPATAVVDRCGEVIPITRIRSEGFEAQPPSAPESTEGN